MQSCSQIITTNKPSPSFFYRPDALPVTQPTVSKHYRSIELNKMLYQISRCQTIFKSVFNVQNKIVSLHLGNALWNVTTRLFIGPVPTLKFRTEGTLPYLTLGHIQRTEGLINYKFGEHILLCHVPKILILWQ